jgi:AraC-like DNA-binding protein
MYNLTRLYSGGKAELGHVCFEHKQAGRYSVYRDVFGCEVSFEQPFNALIFRREGFNLRTRRRSHVLNPILASHLDALSADRAFARDYKTRVAGIIDAQLAAGNCSQAEVAEKLGLSVSTLARRLRAEGVRFRDLLAARRLETAERLLIQDESRVAGVALATGYAEAASFSRAFRRRTQLSPTQYRRGARRPT